MLKLKKLQILGFKSFCDRTELHFPGAGVVGIVGPNGCGKSNIGDAISWVLGEQSAKSLRGGRMEDVIFAGTRERPATGMAEVSLTLADPQECDLELVPRPLELSADSEDDETGEAQADDWDAPAEAVEAGESGAVVLTIRKRRKFVAHNRRGEVVVTRRLFRDGASEYLMNGRPCRLRDIQDLFMGTGLGPESYAIIEQGRIGQILSSKPYDRRAVIEEAAGVSKYKAKRRLAEARLEAARQNLSRINDIFEEVTRQVGSLKRQAAKAQRYQALKAEYDQKQRWVLAARGAALAASQAETQLALAAAAAAVASAQSKVSGQEDARVAAAARCRQLEDDLRHGTEACGTLQRQGEQARQQISFGEQQQQELELRLSALAREREQLESQLSQAAREREEAVVQADAAGELAAAAQAAGAARREEHAANAAEVAEIETGIERDRQASLQWLRQAAALGNQIAQTEAQLPLLRSELERWLQDEARAGAELAAGGERRGQLHLEFQGQQGEAEVMAASQRDLEARVAGLQEEKQRATQSELQVRTRLAEVGARRRSLEEIVAHHGYSSEAVRQLFSSAASAQGFSPLGVLSEYLEAESGCERVLEQFLHDELNYVVVGNWEQAGAGMGLLRQQAQGRATFLVHDAAHGQEQGVRQEAPPEIVGARPLLGQIKALNGFRHGLAGVLPKLGRAYLAQDAVQARLLAAEHPHLFFLTREGECYHHATVTGGTGAGAGPLSLKRELMELQRAESALQAEVENVTRRLTRLGTDLTDAQRQMEVVRVGRHELDKRLLTSGQAVREVESDLARAQSRQQQARLEAERLRERSQHLDETLSACRLELERADDAASALRQHELAAAATLEGARERRAQAAAALAAAQAEAARIEERARAAGATLERVQRQLLEGQRLLLRAREESDALGQRRRQLEAAGLELARSAASLESALAARQQQLSACEKELAEARSSAVVTESALAAAREQLELRRCAVGECEVTLARLEADIAHLCQTCRDELQCELETLALPAEPEAPPFAELEVAVRELRQRLENLGPVNMMALEEYQEAEQRHQFLNTQRQDLLDAIADTQKAIQEMDSISRQKFQEAFERINAYFQESFRVLFGGGQGFLRLSEIEGEGDAGVDIVAQPPGKKLQNALLLSGGEKAMTAMALLLAIFRFQPSPFCLLDEVDAPMDEANVARFSDMIQQMGAHTQFIVITHNKRTMEAAPTLYGVTMPQAGISRLVSVLVEEAQPEAERAAG